MLPSKRKFTSVHLSTGEKLKFWIYIYFRCYCPIFLNYVLKQPLGGSQSDPWRDLCWDVYQQTPANPGAPSLVPLASRRGFSGAQRGVSPSRGGKATLHPQERLHGAGGTKSQFHLPRIDRWDQKVLKTMFSKIIIMNFWEKTPLCKSGLRQAMCFLLRAGWPGRFLPWKERIWI